MRSNIWMYRQHLFMYLDSFKWIHWVKCDELSTCGKLWSYPKIDLFDGLIKILCNHHLRWSILRTLYYGAKTEEKIWSNSGRIKFEVFPPLFIRRVISFQRSY